MAERSRGLLSHFNKKYERTWPQTLVQRIHHRDVLASCLQLLNSPCGSGNHQLTHGEKRRNITPAPAVCHIQEVFT